MSHSARCLLREATHVLPGGSPHGVDTAEVERDRLVARIKRVLRGRFGVEHARLQVEYGEECLDDHPQPRTPESADDERKEQPCPVAARQR